MDLLDAVPPPVPMPPPRDVPHDRVALVTGASRGIGAACAAALLNDGWRVVFAARDERALEQAVRAAGDPYGDIAERALAVPADVTQPASVQSLFTRLRERFGRIDLLFNNAGVSPPHQSIDQMTLGTWQQALDVNLTGMFICMRAAFIAMKTQRPCGGRIIQNGSLAAHVPRPQSAAYAASKHGVLGLTRAAALDGRAYGIAVGQIDIGSAATDMTLASLRGALQADGSRRPEPRLDLGHVAAAVVHMASLPIEANVQYLTVLPTDMPFVGRG